MSPWKQQPTVTSAHSCWTPADIVENSHGDTMRTINTTKLRSCCSNIKQLFHMNRCSIQDKEVTSSASSRVMMGWPLAALLLSDHMVVGRPCHWTHRAETLQSRFEIVESRSTSPHSSSLLLSLCLYLFCPPLSLSLLLFLFHSMWSPGLRRF